VRYENRKKNVNEIMKHEIKELYEFGPFRLDPPERLLICEGNSVPITPRAFDVLVILIRSNGHIVEKSQLMREVWGNCFVEEGNLAVAISTLRKALGDDAGKERKYIQTVAKHGYRFVGQVQEIAGADVRPLPTPSVTADDRTKDPALEKHIDPLSLLDPPREPLFTGKQRIVAPLIAIVFAALALQLRHASVSNTQRVVVSADNKARTKDPSMSVLFSNQAKLRLEPTATKTSEADALYVTGLYFWNKRTVAGLRRSIEYFEQATIKDPRDALSYAGLADAYVLLNSYGIEPSEEAYPSAKSAAVKSMELDKLLPETHASLGMVLFFYEWNWLEAEREFRRAIDLDPQYAMAHSWYALNLLAMGRTDEAVDQAQIAHTLDPLSLIVDTEVGWAFYSSRQYGPAIDAFQNVIDLDQHFARAHTRLGMVYAAKRDFGEAITEFKKAQELSGPDAYVDGLLGYAQAESGNTNAARKLFKELAERSHREYVPAFSMALICIGLKDTNAAMEWLGKAVQERSTYMVYAKTDPLLDSVRSDPRFIALLDRMNFSPANHNSDEKNSLRR
jgi:DNA-binding winged helix-turn-helix (wHTH) protein/Flp pilus assembly protein TadD